MRAAKPLRGTDTVGVAVVGYGYWGAKHVRVLTGIPGVTVTVVDHDMTRLAEARRFFPSVRTATHIGEVADDIQALVVATPPRSHVPIALDAVSMGLHVLVEKPLGVSVEECEKLLPAADEADVVLMVGHTFEHNPAVWKLREIVESRQLGPICYIDTARLNLGLYQPDVNVVWDLAPHDVSILNFLLGRLPDSVTAWGGIHAKYSAEDVAYLRLDYTAPALTAYIHVSWLNPCKVRRVTVVGEEKMVVYNDVSMSEPIRIFDSGVVTNSAPGSDLHDRPVSYRHGDILSPYVRMVEPLMLQDTDFINCVKTHRQPRTDGASGLAVVRVLEAASTALTLGKTATIRTASTVDDGAVIQLAGL